MNGTKRDVIVWGEYATRRPARRPDRTRAATAVSVFPQKSSDPEEAAYAGALARRYREMTELAVNLLDECRRLQQDNDDLRRSAEQWVDLYQRQLDRGNALSRALGAALERASLEAEPARTDDLPLPSGPIVLSPKPDRRDPKRQSPQPGGRRTTDRS
ncbi:MAG TPA: hypothetical protein VFK20_11575 [Vicinamibacterales bacterium]|nr:hypothetical protein [Vicinamibacterales bacterium]